MRLAASGLKYAMSWLTLSQPPKKEAVPYAERHTPMACG